MENIILADYKIFFDTCSLMEPTAWLYISKDLIPFLKEKGKTVIVPIRVFEELRKLQNKEGETGKRALSGLKTVAQMLSSGVLELYGNDENDIFADNYFLYTFIRLRLKHNLALVTQDKKLALDIHDIENHRSVHGQKILLLKIENGKLAEWHFSGNQIVEPPKKDKFEICTQPRNPDNAKPVVIAGRAPSTGDTVITHKYGEIALGEQVLKTKSGLIYHCAEGLACKVYNAKSLTIFQKQKLEKMMEVEVQIQGVCWPLDMAYNGEGEFIGYLMPEFTGKSLRETVFSRKALKEHYPDWTRLELVELGLTWLTAMKQLHDINVLVGGINPSHIFVRSPKEVFLIETDTYQVEDFPCLQSSIDYIAPELKGSHPGTFLQTKEQEDYALATLLFMILLPGKHPFSYGDGVLGARLRSLEFSYPLGDRTSHNTPGKPWRYIWSNLPYKIKQMFSNVFRDDQHISIEVWLKAMSEYYHLLGNGRLNNELFPEKRKILNPCEVTCARCGAREIQEQKFIESITAEGKRYYCENCLAEMRHGKKEARDSIHRKKPPGPDVMLIQGVL